MSFFRSTLNIIQGKKEGFISQDWTYHADSELLSPPISFFFEAKRYIVFGTKGGKIHCLNEHSQLLWSYTVPKLKDKTQQIFLDNESSTAILASPAPYISGSNEKPLILFGCEDCYLYCLDFGGKLIWRFKTGNVVRTTPLIHDIDNDYEPEIIFGSTDGNLYVLDRTGKKIDTFPARSGIESSPFLTPNQNMILFGSNDGYLYAINMKMDMIWDFRTNGKISARPAAADLTGDGSMNVIIGSEDGYLYVFDEDGILSWKFATEGGISSPATIADINCDGRPEILFGSSDDKVYCLSSNGNLIWEFEADFWVVCSPLVTDINKDGKPEIVVGSFDSTLYVLDAEGIFDLNYMPGISQITQQTGHYTESITSEVGDYSAKKLCEIKTGGMVIGTETQGNTILVGTKKGNVERYSYIT